jgi:hypothetical protein
MIERLGHVKELNDGGLPPAMTPFAFEEGVRRRSGRYESE